MNSRCLYFNVALLLAATAFSQSDSASPMSATNYGLVYQIPEMRKVTVTANQTYRTVGAENLKADFYYPPNHRKGEILPVVVFCNGVGSQGANGLKDWEIYRDWGRLVAAKGFLGVNYESRAGHADEDLAELVKHLLDRGAALDVDGARIGVWSCSANVSIALPYLMNSAPAGVRCGVVYYGGGPMPKIRPDLPLFYVKAELDNNQGINQLWPQAMQQNAPWSFVIAKGLPHAFDAFDNSDGSRAIVAQTVEFLESHLMPLPKPVPDSDARKALSKMYGNRPSEAIPFIEAVVKSNPSSVHVRATLADCYERANQLDKAESMAKQVLQDEPSRADTFSVLGKVYFKQQKYAESAAATKRAIELGADHPLNHNGLGLAYLFQNENEKALEALRVFETRNIPWPLGHYNLACAYSRLGQKEKALSALTKAVEVGWTAWRTIELDEDLEPLRKETAYRALIDRLKAAGG